MKAFLLVCSFIFFNGVEVFAQANDSLVAKFPNAGSSKVMVLTGVQLQAKEDYDKGYQLNNDSNYRAAIVYLVAAVQIDTTGNCGSGTEGLAYNELGFSYTRLNKYDSALYYLDKSIRANPMNPKSYLNKASILVKQKKMELAAEAIQSLIIVQPNLAMAYAQLGYIYKVSKKKELAIDALKKYLANVKEQKQEEQTKAMTEGIMKSMKEMENEESK